MNKHLSVKFKIISFVLMIMVVFIHSHNIGKNLLAGNTVLKEGYSSFIQDFFSDGITLVAVPLFFIISGYLFFLGFNGTIKEFIYKYNKRLKTLVVPYLFWSIGVLLLFYVLQFLPEFKTFFGSKLIKDYSLNEFLIKIFITPIPLQLWFLRDLILLTLLSPVIYWLIRNIRILFLLILFFVWFFDLNYIVLESSSLLFFIFGASLSIKKSNILLIDFSKRYYIYAFLWLALVLSKSILLYQDYGHDLLFRVIDKSGILVGVLAVWSVYDFLFKNKDLSNHKFYEISSFSFFLYAFHIPILSVIRRGFFTIMGKGELASLFIYFAVPFVTISIGLFLGFRLRSYTPRFYGVITGNR